MSKVLPSWLLMTSPESLGTASFLLALSPSCLVLLLVNMLHLRNAWICHLKLSSDDISTKKPVGIFPTISQSFRVLLHTLCIPHPALCLLRSAFLCLFLHSVHFSFLLSPIDYELLLKDRHCTSDLYILELKTKIVFEC